MTYPLTSSRVLLIAHGASLAAKLQNLLAGRSSPPYELEWVRTIADGLEFLHGTQVAAILVELPDRKALDILDELFVAAVDIPILVLGDTSDETLALALIARGAQDYLPVAYLDRYLLLRALNHAIEQRAFEDALYLERDRAQVTLNSIGDAVLCTDIAGDITYLNLVAETMTGWSLKEAIGRPLSEVFQIIDGATRESAKDPMEMAVAENRTVGLAMNCILMRRDGFESAIEDSAAPIHDRSGRIIGAVIVFHDVSAARDMSVQMTHSAQHDLVTNLPNRILLNDRIAQAIALAHRRRKQIAVIFLDLDKFKSINDSFGHAIGDKLLQSVSERLVASLRGSDTVSRQGGDEFVILLSDIRHSEDAAANAKRLLFSLRAPHFIGDHKLQISGSLGISIYPQDGTDTETLIHNADTAMYCAKESGRNNFQFFKPEMNDRAIERQSLETKLGIAVERRQFLLHYQPKISLTTGKITGVEALIRWCHPDRGLIPSSQFVPIAEDCGLIVQIGRWVLREACRQARTWQDAGLPPLPVAVNVSAIELLDGGFVEGVQKILRQTGLAAEYLELELTESVLMRDVAVTSQVLQDLKKMGVRLAVDDFGTGYCGLSYLRQFPIDVLKIDQSFVRQITADPEDSIIVRAIINLGESLKLLVIAEGIETREQKEYLQTHHCAEAQGYYFSRPVTALQFARLLETGIPEALDEFMVV